MNSGFEPIHAGSGIHKFVGCAVNCLLIRISLAFVVVEVLLDLVLNVVVVLTLTVLELKAMLVLHADVSLLGAKRVCTGWRLLGFALLTDSEKEVGELAFDFEFDEW